MPGTVTVPSTLKGKAASMWRSTFLSAYDGTCAKRTDRDACAAKIAWAQVKEGHKKGEGGKWVGKAGDPVVGPVSPVPDTGSQAFLGGDFGIKAPGGLKGTSAQRWKMVFAYALANECRNSDQPVECARAVANAAVGIEEKSVAAMRGFMDIVKDYPLEYVERRKFTTETRQKMAEKGYAMEDGTFPIENSDDVVIALKSLGRTSKPRKKVIAHIKRRVKDLEYKLAPPLQRKMVAIERYVSRSEQRTMANSLDMNLIARLGDQRIVRPDDYSTEVWNRLPPSAKTVRAEATRRMIERNYAQAVEDAQMVGWKVSVNHYAPEEYIFSRRVNTDTGELLIRSILVRKGQSIKWELRQMSQFASGTIAAALPAGVIRHVQDHGLKIPYIEKGE